MRPKRRRETHRQKIAHENLPIWPDSSQSVAESSLSAFLAKNKTFLNALKDFIDVDSDQYVSKVCLNLVINR